MSSGISFTCDSCGREVFGCNIVNGMKFCAKCYQETFGNQQKYIDMLNKESSELLVNSLAEKDKQIAELQKQLERHNKYFNSFSCDNFDEFADFISTFMLTPHEEQALIKDLKKQLEEKEMLLQYGKTEIKNLHKRINDIVKRDEKLFKSQPAEIVEKIRNICSIEDKCKDGSFVLGINEKDLDNILKEYQK